MGRAPHEAPLAPAGPLALLSDLHLRHPHRLCGVDARVPSRWRRPMSAVLVVLGILLCALSGLPALGGRRTIPATTPLILAGAVVGFIGCALSLLGAPAALALALG